MFERGLEGFCKVKDSKNEAIMLLNIIRLHKVAAKAHLTDVENTTKEFCGPGRHHFEEVGFRGFSLFPDV